jgi:hypothetical protein
VIARRTGIVLPIAATLLAVAGIVVMALSQQGQRAHQEALRVVAGRNATEACRAARHAAHARLVTAAVDGARAEHRELCRRLVCAASAADLTDLVGRIDPASPLSWKRSPAAGATGVGRVTLERVACRAISLARRDGCPDEMTGLLEIEARVTVQLDHVEVRRALTEVRELSIVLAGPPRPFDQVGLYAGDLARVTDAAAANRLRGALLEEARGVERSIERLRGHTAGAEEDTVARLLSGCSSRVARASASTGTDAPEAAPLSGFPGHGDPAVDFPELPEGPASLVGLADTRGFLDLSGLDLARVLAERLAGIRTAHRELDRAIDDASGGRASDAVTRAVDVTARVNQALLRIWEYQNVFRVIPHDSEAHATEIAAYAPRLAPEWFAERSLGTLAPGGDAMQRWTRGEAALLGVFHIESAAAVRLSGALPGRALLVVDAPAVDLADIPPPRHPGDLLTIVTDRARVRVRGNVHAAVIASGDARVELAPDAHLTGGLAIEGRGAPLALSGRLRRSPAAAAGHDLASSLSANGRGPHVLSLAPFPLWTEGGR